MTLDPLAPLRDAIAAATTDTSPRVVKLATVTGTSGTSVLVQFDGEAAASTKAYKRLTSYTPTVGNRVVMLAAGPTWVCLGTLA